MSLTTVLLVVLVLCVLYLAFRIRKLETAATVLAQTVNKPLRLDRALREEIAQLEKELEAIFEDNLDPDEEDFRAAEVIREKLDRRLRALAGKRRETPPAAPPKE